MSRVMSLPTFKRFVLGSKKRSGTAIFATISLRRLMASGQQAGMSFLISRLDVRITMEK